MQQAQDEYIKAWCALKIMSKVYGFGDPDGFVFNMSVGYDLDGIKGRKVNTYINNMMDAGKTAQFKECKKVLTELFPEEKDFIASISPNVSRSVTLSTLHAARRRRSNASQAIFSRKSICTPSSSATRPFSLQDRAQHPRFHGL